MPADTCSFSTGQYNINALTGPVSTGTCGDRVVVKDAYVGVDCFPCFFGENMIHHQTFTMIQNYFGPGNCTYTIYADSPNVTKDGTGNIITQNVGTYPDEWVIKPVGDNKYT